MKAALGVSWNDAKPRRVSALVALFFATLLALVTAHSTTVSATRSESLSLLNSGSVGVSVGVTAPWSGGGGVYVGSGATWS